MSVKILIVDDESQPKEELASTFQKIGFEVFQASSGNEALKRNHQVDVIISDILMDDGTGVDLLMKLRLNGVKTPFFFYSESMTITQDTALLLGADNCFHKSELKKIFREVLKTVIRTKSKTSSFA